AARRILQEKRLFMGKLTMKLFGSSLFGQALAAAGVGAALMLSSTAAHAQAGGPFAGFDGNWSGTGTVALSNGTTENIRCKADYKVNANGLGLKQNLHCASDSYKFDLYSDVTTQADRTHQSSIGPATSPARATASRATGARRAAISSATCRAPPAAARSKCSSR